MVSKILHGPKLKHLEEDICLGQYFFDMAEKHGEKICQIDAITDKRETFRSVKSRSIRAAIHMREIGITSKDVIVVCTYNTLDSVIPVIASAFLGAKTANLDPTLSLRDTRHLISLVKPTMIFVEEGSLTLIKESLMMINEVKPKIVIFGDSSEYLNFSDLTKLCEEERNFRPLQVNVYETALMFFSSGTTGLPKAICLNHKYFLYCGNLTVQYHMKSDSILHFTTMYWISAAFMTMASFATGGNRVLVPYFDAELAFRIIEKYKVTLVIAAPGLTYSLTDLETAKNYDTTSLHTFTVGGSNISPKQIENLRRLFKHSSVIFGYGMTEAGIVTLFDAVEDKDLMNSKPASCGKVAPGTSIKVIDPETHEILGPYCQGEIYIKNGYLMVGYYNQDSSDCFDDDGFLKTGDVGYYDEDGCFYVVERLKEMFKYRSWHIIPSVIEAVLLEHPHVDSAVVFGIPHEQDGDLPAAWVVPKKDSHISAEEIECFVSKRVSDRERLRGGITIVDSIPKTPSGKIARKKVRDEMIKLRNGAPVEAF